MRRDDGAPTGVGQKQLIEECGAGSVAQEGYDLTKERHTHEPQAAARKVGEARACEGCKFVPRVSLAIELRVGVGKCAVPGTNLGFLRGKARQRLDDSLDPALLQAQNPHVHPERLGGELVLAFEPEGQGLVREPLVLFEVPLQVGYVWLGLSP